MSVHCYRCGYDLAALGERFSRRDLCPGCGCEVHVCRMCTWFDATVSDQCREDDAEHVRDKETANFCDYFKASDAAFDARRKQAADKAGDDLAALFGEGEKDEAAPDALTSAAEDLFRK